MIFSRSKNIFLFLFLLLFLGGGAALWLWQRYFRNSVFSIPAAGGTPFSLRLPKGPLYLQKDPRWGGETIGGSGEKLANVGCVVCSLSMALAHYDIDLPPKALNDLLKTNDGYTDRGWLQWSVVSKVTRGRVGVQTPTQPDFETIDKALQASQPVLAKVLILGSIPHWVLIVGKEGREYLIKDPLGDGTTLEFLSKYRSDIVAIRIVKKMRS